MITADQRTRLLAILDEFPRRRVVLLGDLVADQFVHGEITRVSREAPVLILKEREKQIVPGGGANAANNLIDLGAQVTVVGVLGEDEAGESLWNYFHAKGVSTRTIQRVRGYVTPTKTRVLGRIGHGQPQQIVRLDREPVALGRATRRRLCKSVLPLLPRVAAVLVSDYGYGATAAEEMRFLRTQVSPGTPLTVDSRYGLMTYRRVTAVTPNEQELEAGLGVKIGEEEHLLHRFGQMLVRRLAVQAVLLTRGREGMVVFNARRKPVPIPIFGSDQAVDVTGAGDTVIAVFTLGLAAGADFVEAAWLANFAAGLVVMKRGTATVTPGELREAIRNA